jgi:hypothetical protein
VMLPPLGFLGSAVEPDRWSALRLRAGLTMAKSGGRGYRRGRRRMGSMQFFKVGLKVERRGKGGWEGT